MAKQRNLEQIKEHITNNVEIDIINGCFIWKLNLDITGYGRVRWGKNKNGKYHNWKVHRLIWTFIHGEIPDKLIIRHKCDIWACCNPSHLEEGTPKQHTDDMIERGRQIVCVGEDVGTSKLEWYEVLEIRRRYALGGWTHQTLADHFGLLNAWSIGMIINGMNWAWLHPDYYL